MGLRLPHWSRPLGLNHSTPPPPPSCPAGQRAKHPPYLPPPQGTAARLLAGIPSPPSRRAGQDRVELHQVFGVAGGRGAEEVQACLRSARPLVRWRRAAAARGKGAPPSRVHRAPWAEGVQGGEPSVGGRAEDGGQRAFCRREGRRRKGKRGLFFLL
jgi:hypothetical protein